MKLLILGDTHGCWADLNIVIARALRKHPDITGFIQVGDWGYAFPGTKPFEFMDIYMEDELLALARSIPFYWLDGNHENFDVLEKDQGAWQPGIKYMPRGSTLDFGDTAAMFFGGAASHDRAYRIEGLSWWPQEFITYKQTMDALEHKGQIDVLFSHEHPASFPYSDKRYGPDDIFGIAEKNALEAIREKFKPKWSFFGHHHAFSRGETNGTKWACCPIIESRKAIIWNGDEIQVIGPERGKAYFDVNL